jgi:hypothetical protein
MGRGLAAPVEQLVPGPIALELGDEQMELRMQGGEAPRSQDGDRVGGHHRADLALRWGSSAALRAGGGGERTGQGK